MSSPGRMSKRSNNEKVQVDTNAQEVKIVHVCRYRSIVRAATDDEWRR